MKKCSSEINQFELADPVLRILLEQTLDYLPISNGNENAKKKGKLKVYFLNIIEDQYETAIHLVVMIVIIVQIKTDAQKNYTKK